MTLKIKTRWYSDRITISSECVERLFGKVEEYD